MSQSEPVKWGPFAGVMVTIMAFILAQAIGVLLLLAAAVIFSGQGLENLEGSGLLRTPTYVFLGNIFISGSLFGLAYGFIRLRRGKLTTVGLRRPRVADIGLAIGGYLAYFASYLFVTILVKANAPHWLDQTQEIGYSRSAEGTVLIPIFVSLVLLAPIVEEFLFRGFLYTGLRQKLNIWWATGVTSLLFAAAHLFGGETSALLWIAGIDTLILSIVLCQLRERTGRLWAPMLVHAIKNGIAFTVLFIF